MSSTIPWDDAKARLAAAVADGQPAPLGGLPTEWPNETFTPPTDAPWLSVEMTGEGMSAIEMSGVGAWTERGDVMVHVMTPIGTGSEAGRAIAKALSNLFRGVSVEGGALLYERQILDSGGKDEDGLWWITPFVVRWKYTDRPA